MTTSSTPRRRRVTSGGLALVCGVAALTISLGVPSEAAKLITGKNIKNNSVTGTDIKEKTLKGVLKTGDVAAFGATNSTFLNDFTSGAQTVMVAKNFKAPGKGVLYITGSLSAEDDSSLAGDGRLSYNLSLDGDAISNGLHELKYDGAGAGDSGAMTSVIPVTKGNHTVALTAGEAGTGSFITARDISVLFVPSGSGFTPPARPAPVRPAQR